MLRISSLNYNIEVYVYVLTGYSNGTLGYNSADDATCSCSPTIPELYFNYVSVNPGWFGAGAYDSTALTTGHSTYEAGTTGIGEGVSGGQYAGFGGEYFINTGPITSTVTTTTPITTTTTSAVTTTAPGPCCVQVQGGGVQTTTAISTYNREREYANSGHIVLGQIHPDYLRAIELGMVRRDHRSSDCCPRKRRRSDPREDSPFLADFEKLSRARTQLGH